MGIWPGHLWPYIYILYLISSRAQKEPPQIKTLKKVPESPKSLDDKASEGIPVFTNTVYSNALNTK